jgi:hypothetical protein
MNTNQMMTIQIGKNYTVQIGHLTKMGSLNDVLKIGNEYRKSQGLREIELREWLAKENTWEFISTVERKYSEKFNTPVAGVFKNPRELMNFKTLDRKMDFAKLIKQSHVIETKKGRYGGTWAELFIMLDLANYLSPELKYEMYEVFINQKILFWRDIGGDSFKEFNKIIDTLPDRKDQKNTGIYIQVATQIRKKLEILGTKGYNEKEHNSLIQENRAEWLKSLTFAVKVGFIKSYEELKNTLDKLEVLEK